AVGQAVIGSLARLRAPFFRIFADDIYRGVERVNVDRLDMAHVADLRPQLQGRIDGALRMVLRRPELNVRVVDHEVATLAAQLGYGKGAGDELHDAQIAFEDRRRTRHSLGRQQGGKDPISSRVGKSATLPHTQFAGAGLPQ